MQYMRKKDWIISILLNHGIMMVYLVHYKDEITEATK
jgi:hypothetical protein